MSPSSLAYLMVPPYLGWVAAIAVGVEVEEGLAVGAAVGDDAGAAVAGDAGVKVAEVPQASARLKTTLITTKKGST